MMTGTRTYEELLRLALQAEGAQRCDAVAQAPHLLTSEEALRAVKHGLRALYTAGRTDQAAADAAELAGVKAELAEIHHLYALAQYACRPESPDEESPLPHEAIAKLRAEVATLKAQLAAAQGATVAVPIRLEPGEQGVVP